MVAQPLDFGVGRRMMAAKAKTEGAILVKPQVLARAGRKLHLPARAKEFLEYLDEGTYFKRGFHRQDGTPEHWCCFDMPTWARELDMPKSNVHRIREYLLTLHIIQIQVDNEGTMWIGWNLNTDEWLSPPKHGGARTGAGRHKNQDDNANIQDDNASLPLEKNQDDNKSFQDDNDQARKSFQDDNVRLLSGEVGAGAVTPLRNYTTKKLSRNTPNGVTRAQSRASPAEPSLPEVVTEDDIRFKIAAYFWRKRKEFAPELTDPPATPKGLAKWCNLARLLLARYDKDTIGRTINYAFADARWWAGKMSSMERFHRDFSKIYTDMCAAEKRGMTNGKNPTHARPTPPGAVAFSDAERDAERARRAAAGE